MENNIKKYKTVTEKQIKALGKLRLFGDLVYLPDEKRYIKQSDYYKQQGIKYDEE